MPLLPEAHAASLLKRDDAGRMLFSPAEDEGRYVVPDAETEQRIRRGLKRVRVIQLTAWVLLPAAVIAVLVVTDGTAMEPPRWLFFLGTFGTMMAIQLLSGWARRRLARGLVLGQAREPHWMDKLPSWATVLVLVVIVLAFGVAVYLQRTWPLTALVWLDDITHVIVGSKALAKAALVVGGAVAVLWGGIGALRRWLRPSGDNPERGGVDEKT